MRVMDAYARGDDNLIAAIFLSTFTITLLYNRPTLERYPSLRTPRTNGIGKGEAEGYV